MEKRLNLTEKLDFSEIDMTAPEIVMEQILSQLPEETNGFVMGTVVPYSGHVMSYTKKGFSGFAAALGTADTEIDIQKHLGKLGVETKKFECYLYTPEFTQYKYRMFFMKYDLSSYPVQLILDESVATSISVGSSRYIFTCNSREELEDLTMKILTSKRIIAVMQELIRINQSKKMSNVVEETTDVEDEE